MPTAYAKIKQAQESHTKRLEMAFRLEEGYSKSDLVHAINANVFIQSGVVYVEAIKPRTPAQFLFKMNGRKVARKWLPATRTWEKM
jgi:hypothetical protein